MFSKVVRFQILPSVGAKLTIFFLTTKLRFFPALVFQMLIQATFIFVLFMAQMTLKHFFFDPAFIHQVSRQSALVLVLFLTQVTLKHP